MGKVANEPKQTGGTSVGRSKLSFKGGFTHAKQGKGDPTGAGGNEQSPKLSGDRFVFRAPPAEGAHVFPCTQKSGHFRVSGDKSAHQIGKRK